MAGLPPQLVFVVFSLLLVFTTYSYFFVPAVLRAKASGKGRWGVPDAVFNWCELDYQLTTLVAEPMNTATGALYFVTSFAAWRGHAAHFQLEWRVLLNLLFIALVGVGTVLFHATLRYHMQLLDELPMFYLVLLGVWGLHERGSESDNGRLLGAAVSGLAAVTTVVLQGTPRYDPLHEAFRGIFTLTASAGFIYIFWAAARACAEHQERTGSADMHRLFFSSFLWFVVGILCWLADNTACEALQRLPFYPNLHAWGWHCGTVVGLYFMFLAMVVQRLGMAGVEHKVARIGGLVPVIRPRGKAD